MKVRAILLFLLLTRVLLNSSAKERFHLNDTVPLNEVTVVSPVKTEIHRSRVPYTISVVNQETLDAGTETGILSVLSQHIPGLFVTERGITGYGVSNGSAGTVNIHGVGGGNKILMLFDGQPNWAGIFGHAIPDAYVASDAEKVEIIRGPASLLYGSNAMGGVINVITRQAKDEGFHGQARTLYGSYETWKIMGNAGYKKDKFNAMVSLNRDRSSGHRENSAFHINNGYIKLGYEFSERWNVSGNAIIADFRVENPGTVNVPAIENWAEALRTTYSIALNNKYETMNGAIQAFYNTGQHKINDGWKNGAPREYLFFSSDFNRGIALFESFLLFNGNLFTIGVDAKQWGGRAWNDSINGNQGKIIDKQIREIAAYAVVQQTLFDKLTLNTGIRMENNESYGSEWIPQAGVAYQFSPQTSLKASVSKGFRSPNLRELYLYMPANPNLKPENMSNYDLSYLQSLLDNRLQLELTAYYTEGRNLITTAMIDGKPKNINSGQFTNKGIDFAFNYLIFNNLKITGNYSFLDMKPENPIIGAPKHKSYLGINWKTGRLSFAPNFQYVNGLYTTDSDWNKTENYALLNCKIDYSANPQLRFFIDGKNLTNTAYHIYDEYPMPGIVVLAGFEVKF
ncbi:MAG: TonB-dependent receptor [Dysgonamonadaceae bacterium]|nr:TonB-dependent receptor [Dysgonamonadaceae bacterium]